MDAVTSPATPSASTAGIIWRRRARSRGFQNFRRKTGNGRGRPFRLPRARKKKAGRPEINKPESPGRDAMDLAIATTSFECTIDGGLAHIVLNQPDRGNPIDGEVCREFNLCMAELSERDDVRSVLISARGRLFSVGGDLAALASRGDALPVTIKSWTADLHAAIVRMVRMRAPVVVAVATNAAGGSLPPQAARELVLIGKTARDCFAFCKDCFTPPQRSAAARAPGIGGAPGP